MKLVLNHNFVKISTFILIFSLFFSLSVYANIQAISEDDLARIDAETGITIDLTNTSVYLKVASFGLYSTYNTSGILLSNLLIDDGTGSYASPVAFNINSSVLLDVGTTADRTWLNISGPRIYNRVGITIGTGAYTGVTIVDNGTNDRNLGDLQIRGLFMGRDLPSTSPPPGYNGGVNFTGTTPLSIMIAAHASGEGIDLITSMSLYVDSLTFINSSTANNRMTVSGIYICSSSGGNPQTPSSWTPSGNLNIGNFTDPATGNLVYAAIDVGTTGGKTYLNLNLPLSGSIRIKEFKIDNAHNFGPFAIDNLVIPWMNVRLSPY